MHSKLHGVWGISTATGELVHTPRLANLDPTRLQAPPFSESGLAEEGCIIAMRVNFKRRSLSFRANHGPWWEAKFPHKVGTIPVESRGLRPWVHLHPSAEAARPGDSVMLVSCIPASVNHERAIVLLESAIATAEAQLAECHAAAAAAAGVEAEVRTLASGLLGLGEALEKQDALFDSKSSAALVARAHALQEEVLNLKQAEQRLKVAMDGPLDTELAMKTLEQALSLIHI
eukprot:2629542-Prymnesium_polylepis.1